MVSAEMYERTNISLGSFCKHIVTNMPKIDVTVDKNFLVPIYGFIKPLVSPFTLIFPKERHHGEEKKRKKPKHKQKQSCHQTDSTKIDFFAIKKQRFWEYVPSPSILRGGGVSLSAFFKTLWRGLGMLARSTGKLLIITRFCKQDKNNVRTYLTTVTALC